MSGVQRHRPDHPDWRTDEVQRAVPALPRYRKESYDLSDLPRRRYRHDTEPLEVRIKAGNARWATHPHAGKGNAGAHGGSPGDLYAIIRTGDAPDLPSGWRRYFSDRPVSAPEAALGAKIEVPTIDGRALLKIPPGTQSGQKLRCGKKVCRRRRKEGVRGDEIVEITVTVPMPRDEQTKELLRELAKLNPEDPRADLWTKV